ncbi:50S ribosomal protein L4 [Candidatus Dependentiae bacterium]|nr:50S ribosomal protein L4 [Candidatus Dependentiae bacterium]
MSVIKVMNINGEPKETIELNDKIFNVEVKPELMHEVVTAYLNNQRQGTKATKSRAEVNGTGKKPWRQKGTGRARSGNQKSPVWVGGGHTFALKPADYDVRIPQSKRQAALKSALSTKNKETNIIALEDFNFEKPSTKKMNQILDNLKIFDTVLVIMPEKNENIVKSIRNIPGATGIIYKDINTYQVLKNKYLVLIKSAVNKLEDLLK